MFLFYQLYLHHLLAGRNAGPRRQCSLFTVHDLHLRFFARLRKRLTTVKLFERGRKEVEKGSASAHGGMWGGGEAWEGQEEAIRADLLGDLGSEKRIYLVMVV